MNGPFPSCCLSRFRSESWCSTIQREISFICIRISNHFHFHLKTKTMAMSPTLAEDNYPSSVVSLGQVQLENTKKFRYLGTTICWNEPTTGSSEISARIASARFMVTELKPVLKNPHVPMNIKTAVHGIDGQE